MTLDDYNKMNTAFGFTNYSYFLFCVSLVGAALNFLPLLLGLSLKSDGLYPEYLYHFKDFQFCGSLVAGISTNLPILVDYLFSYCLKRVGYNKMSSTEKKNPVYVPLSETIIFLLLPDILILIFLIPFEQYDFIVLLLNARNTMFIFAILTCLAKISNPIWTCNSVFFTGFPFLVSNVFLSFQSLTTGEFFIESLMQKISTSVGLLSLLVYVFQWNSYIFGLNTKEATNILSKDIILCSAYTLIVFVFILGNSIISLLPTQPGDSWSSTGAAYLTWHSYSIAVCTVSMTVVSSCCSKLDAGESNVKSFDNKRNFQIFSY